MDTAAYHILLYVNWPVPDRTTLTWVAVAFACLFAAAIIGDIARRVRTRRLRQAAVWKTVQDILDDRELSDPQRKTLYKLVRRWMPDDPHRVATVRHDFDRCVENELNRLRRPSNMAPFEKAGVELRDIRTRLGLDYVPLGQRIRSTRELYASQEIWLAREGEKPPQWVRGTVCAVNEAVFQVRPHADDQAKPPSFVEGDEVRCRLWREEDARYAFVTEFARTESDPYTFVLRHTSALDRIQARQHFRVSHNQETDFGIVQAPPGAGADVIRERSAFTKVRGRIVNVSAGGYAAVLPQDVPKQVYLRTTIDLITGESVETDAQIVSTQSLSGGRFLVRVNFSAMDDETRDRIARHVMQHQQHDREQAEELAG